MEIIVVWIENNVQKNHNKKGWTHLNFLYHLFAKGADLRRDANGDVFCSAVLAAHAIENTGALLSIAAQVRLTQVQPQIWISLLIKLSKF